MDESVVKAEQLSRSVAMETLRRHYGDDMEFTAGTQFQSWDLKAKNPVTSGTFEVKFRTGYTASELDRMGGASVELSKADNPENKDVLLYCITCDGVCRITHLTGYTRTALSSPHRKTHTTTGDTPIVRTMQAYYTNWDSEWVDTKIRAEYEETQKEVQRLLSPEYRAELLKRWRK